MGLFLARLLTRRARDRTDAATSSRAAPVRERPVDDARPAGPRFGEAARGRQLDVQDSPRSRTTCFEATGRTTRLADAAHPPRRLDRLARFERSSGSKLNSLRRLMLFGCFVLHVHAVSRWSEREDARPAAADPARPVRRDARLRRAMRVAPRCGRAAMRSRASSGIASTTTSSREIGTTRKEIDDGARSGRRERGAALPTTTTTAPGARPRSTRSPSADRRRDRPLSASTRSASLIELGRRAGFLTPWSNRGVAASCTSATRRPRSSSRRSSRRPSSPTTRSEFPEFLDRLRVDYGVVVGRPEDDAVIRHTNLRDEEFGPPSFDQRGGPAPQRRGVPRTARRVGLRQGYADGRTMVTTAPEGVSVSRAKTLTSRGARRPHLRGRAPTHRGTSASSSATSRRPTPTRCSPAKGAPRVRGIELRIAYLRRGRRRRRRRPASTTTSSRPRSSRPSGGATSATSRR